MELDLTQTLADTTSVALVIALVQVLKMACYNELPARVLPLISLAVSCSVQIVWGLAEFAIVDVNTLAAALVDGILIGLSASGLWTGGKLLLNRSAPPSDEG